MPVATAASAGGRGGFLVALLACLLASGLVACRPPAAAPTPTPAPTPTTVPQPSLSTGADLSTANPADVENAFLSNVDDLIAEASDLTVTPCPDLTQVTHDNPNLVPQLRGFAAAMKHVAGSQAVLNTDSVRLAMGDLDHTMGELEGALTLCGIAQP